jgi:CHAT domain-containing protein
LAKAFFYAGSRALLVSHWPVESQATVTLITRMFETLANDNTIGRSEALRRSMLGLMNDTNNAHYAHPAFWAPFVVVGEGGRG